jgi:thymidylate synthase (FAD)
MKLIESKVEIIEQEPGLEGVYKMAEIAGRTAYKSEDRITKGSAKKFVDAMKRSNHGAVLEHGTVYMTFKWWQIGKKLKYLFNPYSKIRKFKYVTTNLRVLFEHSWTNDLEYFCEPTKHHERRVTAKFICSRGVSHEAVRHRVMSFLQESQRYVGYNKDKFGGEITIIIPEWIKARINDIASYNRNDDLAQMSYSEALRDGRMHEDKAIIMWASSQDMSEKHYLILTSELNAKPEEARGVLTNDCKTELIMTGFISDWEHFFDLRSKGVTGKPHPDIKILADDLLFQFINKGYLK